MSTDKVSAELIQWSQEDVLKLLKLVKINEDLYKPQIYQIFRRDQIQKTWSEIDFQLYKPPGASREKFSNLRAVFRRIHFSQDQSGKQTWKYYPYMLFILPYMKPRKNNVQQISQRPIINFNITETTKSNINLEENAHDPELESETESENTIEQRSVHENVNSPGYVIEYLDDQEEPSTPTVYVEEIKEPPQKKLRIDNLNSESDSSSSNSNITNQCNCNNDTDMIFYRSILPETKMLTAKQKSNFKIKIQQLLHNMLYSDE